MKTQREERETNYLHLLATEIPNLIPNTAETDCPICFSPLVPGEGIVLRECLHTFCRWDRKRLWSISYDLNVINVF